MRKLFLILSTFFLCLSCNQLNKNCDPWIPVLEKSDFSYLEKAVADCLKNDSGDIDSVKNNSTNCILKLKNYYIPMTEVRQLVYDADRLYFLNQKENSIKNLQKADSVLLKIGGTHPLLKKHTADLIYANSNLILSIKNSPNEVSEAFKKIAIEINLRPLHN